jgi:flagellin-like hook-associated protein FlgL
MGIDHSGALVHPRGPQDPFRHGQRLFRGLLLHRHRQLHGFGPGHRQPVRPQHLQRRRVSISTQQGAQQALDAINDAIISKDKIRASLGALQNRLENTITNLSIQAENLQAAESRISDVDVASEMTEFVRNQILTQSAVAMLAQANQLPQMAMQLMQG